MKYLSLLFSVLILASCAKNKIAPNEADSHDNEATLDGVKLGYTYTKGKWQKLSTAELTGNLFLSSKDIYLYSIEGHQQKTSYLRRFDAANDTWINLYNVVNPKTEKVTIDPADNVYMLITNLRTEGSGFNMKYYYSYKVRRLLNNDTWENLADIPNPSQKEFYEIDIKYVNGKLHFIGIRDNILTIMSLNNGTWSETTTVNQVVNSGKCLIHQHSDGKLQLSIANQNQTNDYTTYTFNGTSLQQTAAYRVPENGLLTLGTDGLYTVGDTDAKLVAVKNQKEIFHLPAFTASGHLYNRNINSALPAAALQSSLQFVYAQVQTYVIPEWLNEVLAVYNTETGKTMWFPNTPDYSSKAVINSVANKGKRHYFALQKQVLNASQKHIYYFEEE